jgi:hypothetical protein
LIGSGSVSIKEVPQPLQRNTKITYSVLFAVMVLTALAFFSQLFDIRHTVVSSFAYIDGRFLDFYEFNKLRVGGNDYLPPIYVFFAIWMLPLSFFGLFDSGPNPEDYTFTPIVLLWAKAALFLVFALCVVVFHRLAKIFFEGQKEKVDLTSLAFATSPLAFFAVGIFNQYDVFGVLFTLLGLVALTQKRWVRFSFFLGVAISFKFFAALVALPLVLYFIPRWRQRFASLVSMGFVPLLFALPYVASPAFQQGVFRVASGKISDSTDSVGLIVSALLYVSVLLWALMSDKSSFLPYKAMVLIGLASYGLLFNSVVWHPQWLIIVTPFLALAIGFIRHVKIFILMEALAFLAFVWFVVNFWPGNVDGAMVTNGPLSFLFEAPLFSLSTFYPQSGMTIALTGFNAFLIAAPIYLYFSGETASKTRWDWGTKVAFTLRMASPLALVIIPSLLAVLLPVNLATAVSADAPFARLTKIEYGITAKKPIGELLAGVVVRQGFKPEAGRLKGVSVYMATYARQNEGLLEVSVLKGESEQICSQRYDARKLRDNSYVNLVCDSEVVFSGSETLQIEVRGITGSLGSSPTIWVSEDDLYKGGGLELDGVPQVGDIVFRTHY